jgi:hypothetical protein
VLSTRRKPLAFALVVACIVATAAVGLLVAEPEGPLRWGLLAIVVIPGALLVNGLVELGCRLFMSLPGLKQGTQYVEAKGVGKEFSALRAAWYGLAAVLGFIAVVLAVLGGSASHAYLTELWAQDRCLDQGGHWNARTRQCEGAEPR